MLQKWSVVFLALWFTCASARDAVQSENTSPGCTLNNQSCETLRLSTKLGSSVLLPCNFTQAQNIVSWIQSPTVNVVTITPTGRVNFSDPRFGRIHTFPNEGSLGNYSISISNVNHTDLGCYRCLNQEKCVQVGLVLETEADIWLFPFSIYIVAAVAIVVVLGVGCFLCVNFLKGNKETEENDNLTSDDAKDDLSLPTQETARAPGDGQPQDTPQPVSPDYVNQIVYENDNHTEDEPDYQNEIQEGSEMDRNGASHSVRFNFLSANGESKNQAKISYRTSEQITTGEYPQALLCQSR
ncbi:hypothetical protein NQD34_009334 [Periophthalmus magnuspinnatus]|nr:hypothetical protein NQD34_009334 [Periophthalmus magnuspinnatus]